MQVVPSTGRRPRFAVYTRPSRRPPPPTSALTACANPPGPAAHCTTDDAADEDGDDGVYLARAATVTTATPTAKMATTTTTTSMPRTVTTTTVMATIGRGKPRQRRRWRPAGPGVRGRQQRVRRRALPQRSAGASPGRRRGLGRLLRGSRAALVSSRIVAPRCLRHATRELRQGEGNGKRETDCSWDSCVLLHPGVKVMSDQPIPRCSAPADKDCHTHVYLVLLSLVRCVDVDTSGARLPRYDWIYRLIL